VGCNKSNALLKVYVDIKGNSILLYQDDQLVRRYPIVEIMKNIPTGKFTVNEKIINPEDYLGSRWLGLGKNLGIHGTPLGDEVSPPLGVALNNEHLEDLYALIPVDTSVEITKVSLEFENLSLTNQFGRFPATPLAFPVVPGPHSYIVKRGDTIWKLSRRFNISMESILATNLLPDPNRLEPGQIIHLPVSWPK